MLTMTQAKFAERMSVSRKTVTKWKSQGLLSMTPDGLVKVEESEWLLADRPAKYRGGTTKVASTKRVEPKPAPAHAPAQTADETPEQTADRIVLREGLAPFAHAEAVRIKENYLALLRQLEYERESGKLVAIEDVVRAVVAQYTKAKNKVLAISSRVSPRAAILRSPEEIKALIDVETSLICQELSLDGYGAITVEELRRAV